MRIPKFLSRPISDISRRVTETLVTRTVGDAIDRWLEELNHRSSSLRPGTISAYQSAARHLRRLAGNRPLADWTEQHTIALRDYLAGQPALCRRVLQLMGTLLRRAKVWGWTVPDVDVIGMIPAQPNRETWLPPEHAAQVIVRCYDLMDRVTVGSDRNGIAAILLCLLTGARVSEICLSERKDVSLSVRSDGHVVGAIRVPAGKSKTRKSRSVPLSPKAAAVVQALLRDHDSEWLLPSGRFHGKSICRATVGRQFRQMCQDLGLPHYRVHDLRHTFGTLAVQHGVDLYKVQEALGHTDAWMTRRYAHLRVEDIIEVAEVVARVAGGEGDRG